MIIKSRRVWLDEAFRPAALEITDGKISRILDYESAADFDYGEDKILPGLVDIHNHGYHGRTSNTATREWLKEWCSYLPTEGVTSFLATTSTYHTETMVNAFGVIADAIEKPPKGAQILGIYSEGPLISKEFKGAQDERFLVKPDVDTFKAWQEKARGNIIYVAIAPECDDNFALIKYCAKEGIAVAAGHTGAKLDLLKKAHKAGIKSFTHTYNGMRGLHHREPGVVGAAMRFEDVYCELIGDGVHVHYDAAWILAKIKGKDKVVLITDSVAIKGFPPGSVYEAEGRKSIIDENGVGHLADGTIAGSSNRMCDLVRKLIEEAKVDEVTVINAATINPLKLINKAEHKGYLKEGFDADITVLDKDYKVVSTYVKGVKVA